MFKAFFLLLLSMGTLLAEPIVLVSIAPQKFLVEQIAHNRVVVKVIVPEGASPHCYEPNPKQTIELQQGKIWFRIGEGFEQRLVKMFASKMEIVDQREKVELIPVGCSCSHEAYDPHIWLAPSLLKSEAKQITEVLSRHLPESASFFEENLQLLCKKLDVLDQEIGQLLRQKKPSVLFVSHPAFGYFCREYGLKQIAIEQEGKEPSIKQLLTLLEEAGGEKVQSVFLQKQYGVRGGKRIAKELNAAVVMIDPYQEDVLANLRFLAKTL